MSQKKYIVRLSPKEREELQGIISKRSSRSVQVRRAYRRLEVVRTPVHASWLNIAEIELSVLCRQALQRHIGSSEELQHIIGQWYRQRNLKSSTVDWQFTTEDARITLKRLYPAYTA